MNKSKKPAKIVEANVKFISLCFEGKTGIRGMYKSKGEEVTAEVQHSSKDLGDGRLLTCLYAPGMFDEDVEWSDKGGIQTMISSFAKNGGKIDVDHDGNEVDAYLVESFTIQEGDPRFEDFEGDLVGGWGGILQIDDEDYKNKYANEDWAGASVGGESLVIEGVEPMAKSRTKGIKGMVSKLLRAFNKSDEIKGLHLDINLADPGETDYFTGKPAKDSFHISLNGELLNND